MTNLKKWISWLLCFSIMFTLFPLAVSAQDSEASFDLQSCADEVKKAYYDAAKNESEPPISIEYQTRSYQANITYNIIHDYIYDAPSELRNHYSGSFINEDGDLVVRLCCDTDACQQTITETLGCQGVTFVDGAGSEYEAKQKLDEINHNIYLLTRQVHQEKTASPEAVTLIESLPLTEFNDETLTTTVVFTVSPQVKDVVDKYQLTKNESAMLSVVSKTDQHNAATYKNLITHFRSLVSDDPAISFTVNDDPDAYKVIEMEAWRPGRYLRVVNTDGSAWSVSSGYRVQHVTNGVARAGFITAAHAANLAANVYISTTLTAANRLGTISKRAYGGNLDVAFFQITNTSYTPGTEVYYTSPDTSVHSRGVIMDGTQTTVAKWAAIYKSGQETGLTDGLVFSTTGTAHINNVYFYNMIKGDRFMSEAGDSGGVAYIVNPGTFYGKPFGIVKGGSTSGVPYFMQACYIRDEFNATAY